MRRLPAVVLCAFCLSTVGAAFAQQPTGNAVLDGRTQWRWRVSWRTPIVPPDALRAAGQEAGGPAVLPVQRWPFTSRPDIELLETAPPPAEWTGPDFDDSDWPRNTLAAFADGSIQAGLIALRGRFSVADPATVRGLTLTLAYRGGVVVYVNGKEVGRGDMPEGPIAPHTPANAYPDKAWVGADGQMLPNPNRLAAAIKAGDLDLADRAAARNRSLTLDIPPSALVRGVNVLTIGVHRSDYHPVALNWFSQQNIHNRWQPIGLTGVSLAADGTGVSPNVARPASVRVFNMDIHQRVDADYYGDPHEPLVPIRIAGARNGAFSGMVAVGGDKALSRVSALASDLTRAGGAGTIPASAIDVLYVWLTDTAVRHFSTRRTLSFDGLSPQPPKEVPAGKTGSVQPIWVRVNVPPDAAAGEYSGTLTVSADGMNPTPVPIILDVADYRLPDPREFRTHAGIYQSPTSLAMKYEVPMWSEEHWRLMDASFALLARAGNKLVNIPVVEQTQFGDDEGFIFWVRKPDGSFDYDFTVFDRYIELVRKHLGVPTFVALQVWHSGGWAVHKADHPCTVTVIDPATRKRVQSLQVPVFGTDESKAFWKPVLEAIRARLAKAGMDKSMCFGILSDGTAPPEVFAMFAELAPGVGWTRGCHTVTREPGPYGLRGGGKVVYHEFCYGMSIADPAKRLPKIHELGTPGTAYFRSDFDSLPPLGFHLTAERALYQDTRGFGRNCLDFWDFPGPRNTFNNVYNRWPHSSSAQREPTISYLAWAGPDGPLSTIRYELLLSGLQQAEAMILINEAMDKHADRLGAELAEKCRELFVSRINYSRVRNGYGGPAAWDHSGWREQTRAIYELAGQVAARLK